MLELLISGFQTGADIGAIRAAKSIGLATSGWMPHGWIAEDGPHPEYASLYGAKELPGPRLSLAKGYRERTHANILDVAKAGACIFIFNRIPGLSPGTQLVTNTINELPIYLRNRIYNYRIDLLGGGTSDLHLAFKMDGPSTIMDRILKSQFPVLFIGGNRESSCPGIGVFVEQYMIKVFSLLADSGKLKIIGGRL